MCFVPFLQHNSWLFCAKRSLEGHGKVIKFHSLISGWTMLIYIYIYINTLLKIFKETMIIFLCCVHRVSFIIFSCDQAALCMVQSVRPSVTPYDRSYYQWQEWGPCKRSRSKVKVTEVKTPSSRFRTVTPVRIAIWRWNDAQSSIRLRTGALSFFKVTCQISKSHGTKNRRFGPELSVSGL